MTDWLLRELGGVLALARIQDRGIATPSTAAKDAELDAKTIKRIEKGSVDNIEWKSLREYAEYVGRPTNRRLEDFLWEILAERRKEVAQPKKAAHG